MNLLKLKKITMASLAAVVAITLSACGNGGVATNGSNQVIQGIVGPNVTVANGNVMLSMTFTDIAIDGGATIPIPKYPNSSIEVGPDFQSAGTLLVLTVSMKDFLGTSLATLNPQQLPGGRPLPTVAAGQLPSIALQIPKLFNTVLYLGPQVIGFFVPFNGLNLAGSMISFQFYDNSNKKIGTLSLVGSDAAGKNAGILLLMQSTLLGILGSAPTS